MKRLSLYLFLLLFTLQTPSWADDIRDLQIEGMSIGDSLLDYFSEKEIKDNLIDYDYKDKTFSTAEFFKTDFNYKLYDIVITNFKANDENYIMYAVGGVINYNNKMNQCYEKKNEVAESISLLLNDAKKKEEHKIKTRDPNAESISYIYFFTKEGDRISIECYDFKPNNEYNSYDQLRIGILESEIWSWLQNDAY